MKEEHGVDSLGEGEVEMKFSFVRERNPLNVDVALWPLTTAMSFPAHHSKAIWGSHL